MIHAVSRLLQNLDLTDLSGRIQKKFKHHDSFLAKSPGLQRIPRPGQPQDAWTIWSPDMQDIPPGTTGAAISAARVAIPAMTGGAETGTQSACTMSFCRR